MPFLIIWIVLACVAAYVISHHLRASRNCFKQAKTSAPKAAEETDFDRLSIREGRVEGQVIAKHVKLGELLSIEGETVAGEDFQCILSLPGRGQADLIYSRAGKAIRRVKSGESGILSLHGGAAAVINLDADEAISVRLQPEAVETLGSIVSKAGFSLALSIGISLTEGSVLRYAARCTRIAARFIKVWDIPSAQSDEAILSRVSARADIAELAERIRDIQTATAFSGRHGTPAPLESGVCYILGSAGGQQLSFIVLSEVALLIVPAFEPSMNLPEFLDGLTLQTQMHARIALNNDRCCVAVPNPEGQYALADLSQANVLLSIANEEGVAFDVVRVEQDHQAYNVLTLHHLNSPSFKNVLVWLVG